MTLSTCHTHAVNVVSLFLARMQHSSWWSNTTTAATREKTGFVSGPVSVDWMTAAGTMSSLTVIDERYDHCPVTDQ